jgi:hypothetical protein
MDISIIIASIAIVINIVMIIELHTNKSVYQHIKNLRFIPFKTETFLDRMTERKERKADMRVRPESEANTPLSQVRSSLSSLLPETSEFPLVHGSICRVICDKGNCPLLKQTVQIIRKSNNAGSPFIVKVSSGKFSNGLRIGIQPLFV